MICAMKNILISFLLIFYFNTGVLAGDDPLENINRKIHNFNIVIDNAILVPTIKVYTKITPTVVKKGISNFFSNIADVRTFANHILQFNIADSTITLGRVVVNTTFGIAGLLDVASNMGLTKSSEDFGQTLAVWGMGDGFYIVLPFLGPSNLRDSVGAYVDNYHINILNELDGREYVVVNTIKAIDARYELAPVLKHLKKSDDPYTAIRSFYLQKRQFDIFNGNPPLDDDF